MRHKILIFTFLIFGCKRPNSELLITSDWTITDVEYLTTKRHAPEEVNRGTIFHFNEDGTFDFTSIVAMENYTRSGIWQMNNNSFIIIQEDDTMKTKIEKLTKSELVFKWITEEDILVFSLKSLDQKKENDS